MLWYECMRRNRQDQRDREIPQFTFKWNFPRSRVCHTQSLDWIQLRIWLCPQAYRQKFELYSVKCHIGMFELRLLKLKEIKKFTLT